jgi:hypothetical protein
MGQKSWAVRRERLGSFSTAPNWEEPISLPYRQSELTESKAFNPRESNNEVKEHVH